MLAVLFVMSACGPTDRPATAPGGSEPASDEAPRSAAEWTQPLEARTPATLGDETRLATGPSGTVLFTESYAPGDPLPRFVRLPPELSGADRVLLDYRMWGDAVAAPLPGVRVKQHSAAAAVNRSGPFPRAALDLADVPRDAEVRLQVLGFPLAEHPTEVHRLAVSLPRNAVLEFGYGIREESWCEGAEATRFEVALTDGGGRTHTLLDRTLDPGDPAHRRWFDARMDLSAHAGEDVVLAFSATRADRAGRHSLPAFADPVVYSAASPDTPPEDRPSFVVVSIDTLRARSLGAYGYPRETSPFIDSLAAAGALFETAITTSVTTAPSHMSLFTGMYPAHHGVRRGNEHKRRGLATLAQTLRDAGYATAAFTENGYVIRARGFGEGFAEYTENRSDGTHDVGDARVTFAQARRWLEANRRRPFFLFVHTYHVHTPYQPEAAYAALFDGDGLPGPDAPQIRAARDDYDREIRAVDDHLRDLFEAIEGAAEPERATGPVIAVVLADHGEEFREHGQVQHGGAVFDETLRVPLIFWSPGRIPAGRRIAAQASLIDVAPTLIDLAGLPVPEALDGRSLRAALLGGTEPEPRVLFAEAYSPRRWVDIWEFETWNPPLVAVRSQDEKFIVHRPLRGEAQPAERYDLSGDPLERAPQPVAADSLAALNAQVDEFLRGASDATVGSEAAEPPEALSPDLREHLRALGYAD